MSNKISFAVIALLVWVIAGATGIAIAEYLYGDLEQLVARILRHVK